MKLSDQTRNIAIDIFRGLTMILMIVVNDLWTVHGVPAWMEHTETDFDGMGLADVVFPMFLFAVGLSIPYSIDRRSAKGASGESMLGHIISRTFALIVMGVFIQNADGHTFSKGLYWLIMLAGFFLVWNRYPAEFRWRRLLRAVGLVLLIFLATTVRYKHGGVFRAGWWGILGMIGWAYLFSAVAYLLLRRRSIGLVLLFIGLIGLNILTEDMRSGDSILPSRNFITELGRALNLGNGSSSIMVMGGLLTTIAERSLRDRYRLAAGILAALAFFALGWLSHDFWIISKNEGTLPWCMYTMSISLAFYSLLRILERFRLTGWFAPLAPSGTMTLTVYMIPYIYYAIRKFAGLSAPDWLTGWLGIGKCLLLALLCVAVAWLFRRLHLELKV
ncbi:MAG: DUF5009 domain-containing protein [Candidatus Cryptobacteroides sp.]|nr:DUF5009 domain-containing protein [Candidatus Cryptobacteroides sp.]